MMAMAIRAWRLQARKETGEMKIEGTGALTQKTERKQKKKNNYDNNEKTNKQKGETKSSFHNASDYKIEGATSELE